MCKKLIKHVCEQDYAWSTSTCASECNKHFDVNEYLKSCTSIKSHYWWYIN